VSEFKGTPGPWEADYGGTLGHIKSIGPHPRGFTPTVARYDVDTPSVTDGEKIANAKLIAAAPDLLEACQIAREWFNANCAMTARESKFTVGSLDTAIRKATT
jgi:hypothetical protein